ncbi:MAG: transcriptional regulator [bacterium]|nr:transcriptional regulator [bacterium]
MPTKSYDKFLHKELREPEMAAEYLSVALEEGSITQFLLALRNVADAHGGVGVLSDLTELNRQSMYRMLSERGNPTLSSLLAILHAIGIDVTFRPTKSAGA